MIFSRLTIFTQVNLFGKLVFFVSSPKLWVRLKRNIMYRINFDRDLFSSEVLITKNKEYAFFVWPVVSYIIILNYSRASCNSQLYWTVTQPESMCGIPARFSVKEKVNIIIYVTNFNTNGILIETYSVSVEIIANYKFRFPKTTYLYNENISTCIV